MEQFLEETASSSESIHRNAANKCSVKGSILVTSPIGNLSEVQTESPPDKPVASVEGVLPSVEREVQESSV
jgi:hypothetical protein